MQQVWPKKDKKEDGGGEGGQGERRRKEKEEGRRKKGGGGGGETTPQNPAYNCSVTHLYGSGLRIPPPRTKVLLLAPT